MITPYFKLVTTLTLTGSPTPRTAAGDGNGYLYTVDSGGTLRQIDLVNNYLTSNTVTPTLGNVDGMVMVDTASAYLRSSVTGSGEIINVQTGQKTLVGGPVLWAAYKAQQMSKLGDFVFGTTSTAGNIAKYTISTQTSAVVSPGWLAGLNSTCVISNPQAGTIFVGTSGGTVVECNTSGTSILSLTLPTTPNDGTAPTHIVTNLSFYNDILVVATLNGHVFTYQWSTGTLLARSLGYINTNSNTSSAFGAAGGGGGLTLCEAPSGVLLFGPACDNSGSSSTFQTVFLGSISASGFDTEDYATVSSSGQKITYTGVDHTYNLGWSIMRTTNAGHIQIWTIPSAEVTPVDFRSQYPLGTDVTYRNIIIKYNGPGRSRVIDDRNMDVGTTSLNLRKNARYIGISINGSNYDFRGIDT